MEVLIVEAAMAGTAGLHLALRGDLPAVPAGAPAGEQGGDAEAYLLVSGSAGRYLHAALGKKG